MSVVLDSKPGQMIPATTSGEKAQVGAMLQQEQALFLMAQHAKRDVDEIRAEVKEHCQRLKFAEAALYAYSRGKQCVTGPSRALIDTIIQAWGHTGSGTTILNKVAPVVSGQQVIEKGYSDVLCYAIDRVKCNTKFRIIRVYHWRETRSGGYPMTDERDISEHIMNIATRNLRTCQEKLIPDDIIDEAVELVNNTMASAYKTPLADRVKSLIKTFREEFGITKPMLDKRLARPFDTITETEMVPYRAIYKSLKDGIGKVGEFFDDSMLPPKEEKSKPETKTETKAEKAAEPKAEDKKEKGKSTTKPKPAKDQPTAGAEPDLPPADEPPTTQSADPYMTDQDAGGDEPETPDLSALFGG